MLVALQVANCMIKKLVRREWVWVRTQVFYRAKELCLGDGH